MNEEIHDSSNIPLCISSQNDTAYYINLENNRRRFTVLEEKKQLSSNESEKGLGSSDPKRTSPCLSACFLPGGWSRVCTHSGERLARGAFPNLPAEFPKKL